LSISKTVNLINSAGLPLKPDGEISDWTTIPFFGGTSLEEEIYSGDRRERHEAAKYNLPLYVAKRIPAVQL